MLTHKDYRRPENRREYFDSLYHVNLKYGIMPGLVYLYMPELKKRLGWSEEQALWYAFINSMTQNPITSMVIMEQLPEAPRTDAAQARFTEWFNQNWATLAYDTDRRYGKVETPKCVESYTNELRDYGFSAVKMWEGKTYKECWELYSGVHSFGRLSTFSGLEYHHIMGHVPDCDNLMFNDKSGSKSHRNGCLILNGRDSEVWDKRVSASPLAGEGAKEPSSTYLGNLSQELEFSCEAYLKEFKSQFPNDKHIGKFTLESNFCQFKNGFFGRRYVGVYSDLAWDRIKHYDKLNMQAYTRIFKDIREDCLPPWLRKEITGEKRSIRELGAIFVETGFPYRGEYLF